MTRPRLQTSSYLLCYQLERNYWLPVMRTVIDRELEIVIDKCDTIQHSIAQYSTIYCEALGKFGISFRSIDTFRLNSFWCLFPFICRMIFLSILLQNCEQCQGHTYSATAAWYQAYYSLSVLSSVAQDSWIDLPVFASSSLVLSRIVSAKYFGSALFFCRVCPFAKFV